MVAQVRKLASGDRRRLLKPLTRRNRTAIELIAIKEVIDEQLRTRPCGLFSVSYFDKISRIIGDAIEFVDSREQMRKLLAKSRATPAGS